MGRFLALALGVIVAFEAVGVFAEPPPCIVQWTNDVRDKQFTSLGCKSAGEAGCLCQKPEFQKAIVDSCAKNKCAASAADVFASLKLTTGFCVNLNVPNPGGAASSAPAASTPAKESNTPSAAAPSTSQPAPTTSSAVAETTAASTSTIESSAAATSATPEATESSSSAEPSTTSSSEPSATSQAASTSTSAAAGGGLSQGAIAGIGIAVGVVVIALAGIGICLCLRRRSGQKPNEMEISKPLPGSGRTYPVREDIFARNNSFEKYGDDIELRTQRYEDTVPQTQPRNMV